MVFDDILSLAANSIAVIGVERCCKYFRHACFLSVIADFLSRVTPIAMCFSPIKSV